MGVLQKLQIARARKRGSLPYEGLSVPASHELIPDAVLKQIMRDRYERPEIAAVRALVRPGDGILELGTGLGIVSAIAARTDPAIRIESYEANPGLLDIVRDLHRRNGIQNVMLHNAILLPEGGGTRRFHFHRFFPEGSIRERPDSTGGTDVPVRAFGEAVAAFQPDVLICDIEGAEEELFADIDLAPFRAIILELHPDVIPQAAVKRIFETCLAAGLAPRLDVSAEQVVAFERVT